MTLAIRRASDVDDGWGQLVRVDALAFGGTEELDNDDRGIMELDRAVLAYEGDEVVGCASLLTFDLSVPGGGMPTAGLTWVGVVPTHRRRGVMTALLADRHAAAREAGEAAVALWASQSAIYPRFGYGAASRSMRLVVPQRTSFLQLPDDAAVAVTLVDSRVDAAFTRPLYERVRHARPGMPALDDRWYARSVNDRGQSKDGWSPLRTFVASLDGDAVGYARFRQKHDWTLGVGEGTVQVVELLAEEPRAAAALWRHLLALESMARTESWNAPMDEPLLRWVSEIRDVEVRIRDQLYVRVLDVAAALSGRTYRAPLDVVIEVSDPMLPQNQRRWRLAGDPAGATCAATRDPADLVVDVRVLGATLLGGTSWHELAAAGAVGESRTGALERASLAFQHPVAPWCPWVF